MICVTKIETVVVERDVFEILKFDPPECGFHDDIDPALQVKAVREAVKGYMFGNAKGERVCIGWTLEGQEAVGLPFEAFDNMSRELRDEKEGHGVTRRILSRLADENLHNLQALSVIDRWGFWARLVFLFRGSV
jgi:hypothetical protein